MLGWVGASPFAEHGIREWETDEVGRGEWKTGVSSRM